MTTAATQTILSPQLAVLKEQLLHARERLRRLCQNLSEAEWRERPGTGGWCIGECVSHLNLTTEKYLPLIDAAIEQARTEGLTGQGPFKPGILGSLLLWWLEPPYKRGSRTNPEFEPADISPMVDTLERFDALQQALQARIERSAGLALNRVRLTSAFDARVKYNLYATFAILAAHQRRHLWQGERVRAAMRGQPGVTRT